MEYKEKGMMDNREVKEDHQQGIKRVLQKGHDPKDYCGHFGSMKGGWNHGKDEMSHRRNGPDHFKRSGSSLTPRKA